MLEIWPTTTAERVGFPRRLGRRVGPTHPRLLWRRGRRARDLAEHDAAERTRRISRTRSRASARRIHGPGVAAGAGLEIRPTTAAEWAPRSSRRFGRRVGPTHPRLGSRRGRRVGPRHPRLGPRRGRRAHLADRDVTAGAVRIAPHRLAQEIYMLYSSRRWVDGRGGAGSSSSSRLGRGVGSEGARGGGGGRVRGFRICGVRRSTGTRSRT